MKLNELCHFFFQVEKQVVVANLSKSDHFIYLLTMDTEEITAAPCQVC